MLKKLKESLKNVKSERMRIAVKVGSNVLTRPDGRLDIAMMASIVDQIADLSKKGCQILLISSGAVASGRGELPDLESDGVEMRQLFAAVGQAKLIEHYYDLFREYGVQVGQILTTKENFSGAEQIGNQKRCMNAMLANGIIPVINENDAVSVKELMFTDNDELSGLIADMMQVDLLIILTNVDGVFTGSPENPSSELIRKVDPKADYTACIGKEKSSNGRGGMGSKLSTACQIALGGIPVYIANGRVPGIITGVMEQPDKYRFTMISAE